MKHLIRNLLQKPNPFLGLEMTATGIKVCELHQQQKQQIVIKRCALEPLSSATEPVRAEALQTLIEKTGIEGCQVALAVSGLGVFTRLLSIDKSLKETEIQEQIELGLETWFPFPVEEIFYDFTIMDALSPATKMQEVYVAVAQRKFVESQRTWIESFGLKVAVVEVSHLALERAFRLFLQPLDPKSSHQMKSQILLDIGDRHTILYVFRDHHFIYTQDIGLGINQYLSEGEGFKEALTENVHRTLQHFFLEVGSKSIISMDSLILSGEFSQELGLEEILQEKLETKVFLANPFKNMVFPSAAQFSLPEQEAHRWLSVMGIAAWPFDHG